MPHCPCQGQKHLPIIVMQNASEDLAPAEDRGVGTPPQLDVEAALPAGADKGDVAGLGSCCLL